MKKIVAVLMVGVLIASMGGCAALGKPLQVPDEPMKDKPEPPKPTKLPPPKTDVDPDEITDENYSNQANLLEKEMKREKRYLPSQD